MAAKGARESITLACSDCKRRNYTTEKNKKNTCIFEYLCYSIHILDM